MQEENYEDPIAMVFGDDEKKEPEQGQVKDDDTKKIKKKANVYRFKPDMITDTKKGLVALYKAIGKTDFNFGPQNLNEIKELDKYIKLIQEWHYYTVPKYDFQYFTERCQKFGAQPLVKTQLQQMRQAHKQIIPWEFIEHNINENGTINEPDQFINNQPPPQAQPIPNDENINLPDQQIYQHIHNQISQINQPSHPFVTPLKSNKKIIFKPKTQVKASNPNNDSSKDGQNQQVNVETSDFLDGFFNQIEEFEILKAQNKRIKEI